MGVRAGLTVISAEAFDEIVAGKEPDCTGPYYPLDKAWRDFRIILEDRDPPLRYAISGDVLHPQSPHTLEEFCEGNHEWYAGFVSPRLVREIAAELEALPPSEWQRWYDERCDGSYDPDGTFFQELKAAYGDAARSGRALMIFIA
ncbi:MAG: hypothetical protein WD066_18765 [Planctomycetaceae bacterium]